MFKYGFLFFYAYLLSTFPFFLRITKGGGNIIVVHGYIY